VPTPEEIRAKLADLLRQIADVPADAVRDTAALKDLGIDSVAINEFAEGITVAFDTRLSNETVNEWRTIGDVVRTVQRGDSFLASLPPPQLDDPERVGAFKQLTVVLALIGAGVGVLIGVAAAALLASSILGGGSLPPIDTSDEPTPFASPSETADPFGDADRPTPSETPTDAALAATPELVDTGEDFQLSGRLPGAQDGEELIIEWREDGGTWAPFPVTATARPDGTFETRMYIGSPGEREFRVRNSSGSATPTATVRIS
jgi:acyl carrier protein